MIGASIADHMIKLYPDKVRFVVKTSRSTSLDSKCLYDIVGCASRYHTHHVRLYVYTKCMRVQEK